MTAPRWGIDPEPEEPASSGPDAPGESELPETPKGPPGGGIFTLEGKRAPGLYLIAWLLAAAGLSLTFLIGPMANSDTARLVLIGLGVLLTTTGLLAGAGSQVMERGDRHPDRYRGPSPLLAFAAYYFGVTFFGVLLVAFGYDGTIDPAAFVVIGVVQALGYLLVVWLFAVRSGAMGWADMGWPTWTGADPRSVVANAVTAALLMVPVTFAVLIFGGILATLLGTEAPDVLPTAEGGVETLMVVVVAAFLIPIGEEVFFRGFALSAWRRDLGDRPALIRSSIFFAVVHILNIGASDFGSGLSQAILTVAVILPVGFVLGWLFLRRGLIGAIAGHATYNTLLLLLALAATGAV